MSKIRIRGCAVNPYTYSLIKIDEVVKIRSEEAAIKWAKQTYFKAMITSTEILTSKGANK